MTMKHDYAREKLTLLLRDLDQYNGDEFWRQMSRIANGATHHPSAEGLQEALKLAVTCLGELYKALGVGDTNETFQHSVALRTVIDLKERHRKQNARIHELRNQTLAVSTAANSLANAVSESEADAALDAIEAAIGQKPSNITENMIQSFLVSYNTHPKKNEFLSINGYFDWWKANRRQVRQQQETTPCPTQS